LDQLVGQQLQRPTGTPFRSLTPGESHQIGFLSPIEPGFCSGSWQFVEGVIKPLLTIPFAHPLHRRSAYFQGLRNFVVRFALMGEQQDVPSSNGSRRVLSHFEQIMQVLSIFLGQVDFVDQNHRFSPFSSAYLKAKPDIKSSVGDYSVNIVDTISHRGE
jgi:hypothetical protein